MNVQTVTTTGSARDDEEVDPRLEQIKRLAREAKEGHAGDFTAALARFRDTLASKHTDLALYLVRESFERATWAEMRRLEWGSAGVQMQQNAKAERDAYPDQALDEATKEARLGRKRAGQMKFAKASLLLTYQVNGRALGFCTRADLRAKVEANDTDSRFLRTIATMLPDDAAQVRQHVTDAAAEKAMKAAKVKG